MVWKETKFHVAELKRKRWHVQRPGDDRQGERRTGRSLSTIRPFFQRQNASRSALPLAWPDHSLTKTVKHYAAGPVEKDQIICLVYLGSAGLGEEERYYHSMYCVARRCSSPNRRVRLMSYRVPWQGHHSPPRPPGQPCCRLFLPAGPPRRLDAAWWWCAHAGREGVCMFTTPHHMRTTIR
jgi:hypothetical protein